MLIFVKVLFRQLKTRFFVLIQLIKRLLCCFRNKTDLNENAEEIIGSNFVIVQQNTQPVKNTVMTNIYDQETSLNEWDAMAPDSVRSTQQKCKLLIKNMIKFKHVFKIVFRFVFKFF